MTFDYPGYDLKFIQRTLCKDSSDHLFTDIFTFYSPIIKYRYVLRAEYHKEDVFVVKFYAKAHKKSDYKYSKITNKGDMGNILITCVKSLPLLLNEFPNASFGFIGAITVDSKNKRKKYENIANNQRYRVYSKIAAEKIGTETFTHYTYPEYSSYLLLNNKCPDIDSKEHLIKKMFAQTYTDISYI